jgi:hypothetical protein
MTTSTILLSEELEIDFISSKLAILTLPHETQYYGSIKTG